MRVVTESLMSIIPLTVGHILLAQHYISLNSYCDIKLLKHQLALPPNPLRYAIYK